MARKKKLKGLKKSVKQLEKAVFGTKALSKTKKLPGVKKLSREQIAQKLLERRARTQARIERARILRTPTRLR